MAVGRVHLFYGFAGSGKTILARELSSGGRGVRFTLDEWMLRLHPGLHFESADYGEKAAEVREVIWTIAEQILVAGVLTSSWTGTVGQWLVAAGSSNAHQRSERPSFCTR